MCEGVMRYTGRGGGVVSMALGHHPLVCTNRRTTQSNNILRGAKLMGAGDPQANQEWKRQLLQEKYVR